MSLLMLNEMTLFYFNLSNLSITPKKASVTKAWAAAVCKAQKVPISKPGSTVSSQALTLTHGTTHSSKSVLSDNVIIQDGHQVVKNTSASGVILDQDKTNGVG